MSYVRHTLAIAVLPLSLFYYKTILLETQRDKEFFSFYVSLDDAQMQRCIITVPNL